MICLHGVSKNVRPPGSSHPVPILRNVDLRIEAGEQLSVLGRSGSGKSTLMAVVGLLDIASGGSYALDGRDMAALRTRERDRVRSSTFGFLFQRFCLMPHLSALENVESALLHTPVRGRERSRRSRQVLASVGLQERSRHRPAQLSGGEQQRVALARALVADAPVLLADEPTGSLDEVTARSVMDLLRSVATEHGRTLVVVTHDRTLAATFPRSLTLEQGCVTRDVRAANEQSCPTSGGSDRSTQERATWAPA